MPILNDLQKWKIEVVKTVLSTQRVKRKVLHNCQSKKVDYLIAKINIIFKTIKTAGITVTMIIKIQKEKNS
jgi:hypothetical protein